MRYSQYIGTTPAGVEWVAYRPQDVPRLTKRLAAQWKRHHCKIIRVKLTPAMVDHCHKAYQGGRPVPGKWGATFVVATRAELADIEMMLGTAYIEQLEEVDREPLAWD